MDHVLEGPPLDAIARVAARRLSLARQIGGYACEEVAAGLGIPLGVLYRLEHRCSPLSDYWRRVERFMQHPYLMVGAFGVPKPPARKRRKLWAFEVRDAWQWDDYLDRGSPYRGPLQDIELDEADFGEDPRRPLAPWEEYLRWPRVHGRAPRPASLKNSGPETR